MMDEPEITLDEYLAEIDRIRAAPKPRALLLTDDQFAAIRHGRTGTPPVEWNALAIWFGGRFGEINAKTLMSRYQTECHRRGISQT